MNKSILTDSDILETVNESVNDKIDATIIVGSIVLIIFAFVAWDYLRNSEPADEQGCTEDSANQKKKTILAMVGLFLFIVGLPILIQWNSYIKISDDDWHVEETVVTDKFEDRDEDTDTHSVTYTYGIYVEGYTRSISVLSEGNYNSVDVGDEVYVVVCNETDYIYDFYPMDSYIYEGEHLE